MLDNQTLCHITDARHLLSILNQRKLNANAQMVNKKEMPEPKADALAELHPNGVFAVAELSGRKYKAKTERLLETIENVR